MSSGDASGQGVAAAAYRVVSQPSGFTQGIMAAKGRLVKQGFTILHLELVVSDMTTNLATNPVDGVLLLVQEHSGTQVDKGRRRIQAICAKPSAQNTTEGVDKCPLKKTHYT